MRIAAMTAAVNHAFDRSARNFKTPAFVIEQSPQVILAIEKRPATARFMPTKFRIAIDEQLPISLRRDPDGFLIARRAVSGKSENADFSLGNNVDQRRNFIDVQIGDRRHDHRTKFRAVDDLNFVERRVERAGLSEKIMRAPKSVERHLILPAAECFQSAADVIVEMKRIAHDRERIFLCMQPLDQSPKIVVKNRIAAGDVKQRTPLECSAEVLAILERREHPIETHRLKRLAIVLGEDVAVLATLIARVGDMPLKREWCH